MPTFGIQYLWVLLLLRLPSVVLSRGKFAIGTEIIKHYYNVKLFLLLTIILLLAFLQNLYIFLEVEEKCLWCSVLYFSHLEQFLWRFLIVKRLCLMEIYYNLDFTPDFHALKLNLQPAKIAIHSFTAFTTSPPLLLDERTDQ